MEEVTAHDIPDSSHLDMVLDGLADTVDGNESFTLTSAQHYIYGVLGADDTLSYQQRRGGCEGFFDTLGDGIGAIWEYIKKMWGWLTSFFTGGGQKKKIDETKADLKKVELDLKQITAPTVTTQNFFTVCHQIQKKVEHLPDTPQKAQILKEVEEVLHEVKPEPAKAPEHKEEPAKSEPVHKAEPTPLQIEKIKHVIKEVFDLTLADKHQAVEIGVALESIQEGLEAIKKKNEEAVAASKDYDNRKAFTAAEIEPFLKSMVSLPDILKHMDNLEGAKKFITEAERALEAMSNTATGFANQQGDMKHQMDELENGLKELKPGVDAAKKKEMRNKITILKSHLAPIADLVKLESRALGLVTNGINLLRKGIIVTNK